MKSIIKFLDSEMNEPQLYGSWSESWFQYISLVLMVLGIILLVRYFKKSNVHQTKKVLLIAGIIMLLFEVYKQVIFTYQASEYQWYAFPFQFCSTPMYLYTLYGLSKNKKLDRYIIAFLATYGAFAGLAVMLYPSTVFVSTIGINIQTMVHHGFMAIIGVSLMLTKIRFNQETFIKAGMTFTALVIIAIFINFMFNLLIHDGTFNMFFINPKFEGNLPVLSIVEPHVPHFVYMIVYIAGFSFSSYLTVVIITNVSKLIVLRPKSELN